MKKIPTLFTRVIENHKVIDITDEITPGCDEAFLHGTATVKFDGSCCAVINGEFYKRYDAKKGKPVPENAIKCQEEADPVTGHLPCWIPCDRENKADKWFWEAYDNYKNGLLCENSHIAEITSGTYEAIGPHFQGNPYKLTYDVLQKHGLHHIKVGRTFEAVKQYITDNYIEGIVFWYNGEPVCKIKRTDFGLEWKGYKKY